MSAAIIGHCHSWSQEYEETDQDLLIAYPRTETFKDSANAHFNWAMWGRKGEFVFVAPIAGLVSRLRSIFGDEPGGEPQAGQNRQNVWICQYRPGDTVSQWAQDAHVGSIIRWGTEPPSVQSNPQPRDAVVYWRTIHPDNPDDRGGLVGTGRVVSTDLEREPTGSNYFTTEIQEFFEDQPILRDEVIRFTGIDPKDLDSKFICLPIEPAVKIDQLLQERGLSSLYSEFSPQSNTPVDEDGLISVLRDDAERDHDALGRAPLAVSLAWTLHEIWCTEQGLEPFPHRTPQSDAAGFLAHIDSPWGGGKTSFANLIARTLNPGVDGKPPEFLKFLYTDRTDMSGLFISARNPAA